MFQIQSTSSVALSGVKAMLYGKSGAGKTHLASTAPAPFIISMERGLLTLRKFNLPFVQVNNIAELGQVYNWLTGSQEARQFQTVFLDSGSELAEIQLAQELKGNKDGRKAYGEMQQKITPIIRQFRDLPGFHVVMTFKQEFAKDGDSGAMMFQPSAPGDKFSQSLPYFFDELWQIYVGKEADGREFRAIKCQPDFQTQAKSRIGLSAIEPANLSYLFTKAMGQ